MFQFLLKSFDYHMDILQTQHVIKNGNKNAYFSKSCVIIEDARSELRR